ncbi:c-type cytochrome biogenesis protein CcmI [Sneathiella litorea]|uniref:C-type cytochrome biogenesis protein CcmI n=1 Tax=Sneathiella litorea TaxID=2606216 RepID=A0A6L8W4P2_9PROT|nr:c-type cytochrome biogenesis protein CcmI [Sneathiella litorea]MZR29473.1 c-type cytochrome biogenesis protein CcmI [Sneathiella litorea]
MIWIILSLILLVAIAILVWPFLGAGRSARGRVDQGLEVYRQQLNELSADVARGAIGKVEADAMETEIKRRLLRLGRVQEKKSTYSRGWASWQLALILAIAFPVISLAIYSDLGTPEAPARPLASRDIEAEKAAVKSQDVASLIQRLVDALKAQPENLEGWVLLAQTLSRLERYDEAAETYIKATLLAPNAAELFISAGENYYFASEGTITPQAEKAFEKAFALNPDNPGARYYLALRDAQEGDSTGALKKWIALYEESPAGAPFMPVLARRIEQTAEMTGTDIGDLLSSKTVPSVQAGPTSEDMAAAANMSPDERQAMITSMVEGLASRMNEAPDYEGLMRLGQAYGTLQEYEKSVDAYRRARELNPEDLTALQAEAFAHVQVAGDAGVPPAAAVELYNMILERIPDHQQALWYLGVAEAASGNNAEAIDLWTRLQALTDAESPVHIAATEAIKSLSASDKN